MHRLELAPEGSMSVVPITTPTVPAIPTFLPRQTIPTPPTYPTIPTDPTLPTLPTLQTSSTALIPLTLPEHSTDPTAENVCSDIMFLYLLQFHLLFCSHDK